MAGRAAWLALTILAFLAGPVLAEEKPIVIGEISSYSALPVGTEAYKKGWLLALDDINAHGGVLGRPVNVIFRDDAGKPEVAITQANSLVSQDHVDLLAGTILSNVGLAVADFARQKKIFFLATQPLTDAIIWQQGSDYTFRLRPSTYTQAMILAEQASKLPSKRWATIAPNYEFGQAAVADFKAELQRLRPDVTFVSEQWPPLGKLDAGAIVEATAASKPDAIFNATFGPDLLQLVRQGNVRGLFEGRQVVSILTGEPEYLDPLKDETPPGWIVTGYPWKSIDTPAHKAFLDAYQAKYHDYPRIGSLMGYTSMLVIAQAITKAGSTDTPALIVAMKNLQVATPSGEIRFRAIDHQSTMGVYVGRLELKDDHGVMVDWHYADGAHYQPPDDFVRAKRPPE